MFVSRRNDLSIQNKRRQCICVSCAFPRVANKSKSWSRSINTIGEKHFDSVLSRNGRLVGTGQGVDITDGSDIY